LFDNEVGQVESCEFTFIHSVSNPITNNLWS